MAGQRKPRKPQFNVALSEKSTQLLLARASQLDLAATTLAGQLLEKALAERESPGGNPGPTPPLRRSESGEILEVLGELRKELLMLRKAHYNATKELLSRSGPTVKKSRTRMSVREIEEWAEKHLMMKSSRDRGSPSGA